MKVFVVYCSPAGTTRQVGLAIRDKLDELGLDVVTAEIGRPAARAHIAAQINDTAEPVALFIGSPVYASIPVPPVMDLIDRLQEKSGTDADFAIPFVTWGLVTSGQALWYMGQALINKGFTLAGGISTVAQHSLQLHTPEPLGFGHPSPDDLATIGAMLDVLAPRLQAGTVTPFPLDAIDDYPEPPTETWQSRFDGLRANLPAKTVNEALCTQCDTCQDECPVAAITLNPYPVIDMTTCIVCYNCVRLCPDGAMQADISRFDGLPQMAAESRVPKIARTFYA